MNLKSGFYHITTYPSSGVHGCKCIPFINELLRTKQFIGQNHQSMTRLKKNPQIRKRCAFVRPIFYYFISIRQLGIKATYCINYAELFSYVTQYKKSRELIRVDLGQKCKPLKSISAKQCVQHCKRFLYLYIWAIHVTNFVFVIVISSEI